MFSVAKQKIQKNPSYCYIMMLGVNNIMTLLIKFYLLQKSNERQNTV